MTMWIDLSHPDQCDAGVESLTRIGVGAAPKSGALFLPAGRLEMPAEAEAESAATRRPSGASCRPPAEPRPCSDRSDAIVSFGAERPSLHLDHSGRRPLLALRAVTRAGALRLPRCCRRQPVHRCAGRSYPSGRDFAAVLVPLSHGCDQGG